MPAGEPRVRSGELNYINSRSKQLDNNKIAIVLKTIDAIPSGFPEMTVSKEFSALAADVKIDDELLTVHLTDGRIISVPIACFPKLLNATSSQRKKWRLIGRGQGIIWEELDEDLSVAGLLRVQ